MLKLLIYKNQYDLIMSNRKLLHNYIFHSLDFFGTNLVILLDHMYLIILIIPINLYLIFAFPQIKDFKVNFQIIIFHLQFIIFPFL